MNHLSVRNINSVLILLLACLIFPIRIEADEDPLCPLIRKMPVIYQNHFVCVVSDKPLTKAQGKKVADLIDSAYAFDRKQLGWQNDQKLSQPITAAILSRKFYDDNNLNFMGGAIAQDLFAMYENFFKHPELYAGVTAHEISHLLVWRQFGDFDQQTIGWSGVWGEGVALHNGKCFRLSTSPWKHSYPTHRIEADDNDEKLTAADAKWIFRQEQERRTLSPEEEKRWGFRYGTGQQFIEFLRTRLNGAGCSDTMRRLGDIASDMAATHKLFKDEFKEHFATDYAVAQDQFTAFLAKTQGNPAERFAGTFLEPQKPSSKDTGK